MNAGVLLADYDFEGHRELVGMQPGDVPVTYADSNRNGNNNSLNRFIQHL